MFNVIITNDIFRKKAIGALLSLSNSEVHEIDEHNVQIIVTDNSFGKMVIDTIEMPLTANRAVVAVM